MTVLVYTWLPQREHIGHASLQVNNTYMSFWLEGRAGKKDATLKTDHVPVWS